MAKHQDVRKAEIMLSADFGSLISNTKSHTKKA